MYAQYLQTYFLSNICYHDYDYDYYHSISSFFFLFFMNVY